MHCSTFAFAAKQNFYLRECVCTQKSAHCEHCEHREHFSLHYHLWLCAFKRKLYMIVNFLKINFFFFFCGNMYFFFLLWIFLCYFQWCGWHSGLAPWSGPRCSTSTMGTRTRRTWSTQPTTTWRTPRTSTSGLNIAKLTKQSRFWQISRSSRRDGQDGRLVHLTTGTIATNGGELQCKVKSQNHNHIKYFLDTLLLSDFCWS